MKKVKLGDYIEKISIKAIDLDDYSKLEVFGVSNIYGITKTNHVKSSDLSKYLYIEENYFAYNPYRINVGSIGLTPKNTKGLVSPAYIVFKTKDTLKAELLFDFLKSFDGLQQINKLARGTVRKALRYDDLCQIKLYIPSIEKQEKILQLKLKVQQYNNKLQDEIQTQQTLLKQLRQSILQEAIEGKLTISWREKNPNIESATLLLEKIKAEKERLIKEKKIKKQKALASIDKDEICISKYTEDICWCRLSDLFKIEKGLVGIKKAVAGKYPLVVTSEKRLSHNEYQFDGEGIIIPLVSSTGHRHASLNRIHYQCGKFSVGSILALLTPINNKLLSVKLYHRFLSIYKDELLVKKMTGAANVSLTITSLSKVVVPYIHIDIQKKIETLFSLCDKLEEQINISKKSAEMLIQSVLKEAFGEDK